MRYVEFHNPEPSGTGKDRFAWGLYMRVHLVMTEFLMWIWAPAASVMDHWDKDASRSSTGMGSRIRPEEGEKRSKDNKLYSLNLWWGWNPEVNQSGGVLDGEV